MLLFSVMSLMFMAISLALVLFSFIASPPASMINSSSAPFECGFSPILNARTPFSLKFFFLALLFLVFDIELILLLPAPLMLNTSSYFFAPSISLFTFLLLVGLLHEWNQNSLEWSF